MEASEIEYSHFYNREKALILLPVKLLSVMRVVEIPCMNRLCYMNSTSGYAGLRRFKYRGANTWGGSLMPTCSNSCLHPIDQLSTLYLVCNPQIDSGILQIRHLTLSLGGQA